MAKKKNKVPEVAVPGPSKDGEDYEANNAYDTLVRAHEHMEDPEMMARVKKRAGRKHKALMGLHEKLLKEEPKDKHPSSIAELRDISNKRGAKKNSGYYGS